MASTPPRPLRPAPLGDRPPRRSQRARRRLFGRRRLDGAPPPRPRLGRAAGHPGRGAARRPRPARRGGARRRALLRGAGRAPRHPVRLSVRRRPGAEEEGRERRIRRAAAALPRAPVHGRRDGGRSSSPVTRATTRPRPSSSISNAGSAAGAAASGRAARTASSAPFSRSRVPSSGPGSRAGACPGARTRRTRTKASRATGCGAPFCPRSSAGCPARPSASHARGTPIRTASTRSTSGSRRFSEKRRFL